MIGNPGWIPITPSGTVEERMIWAALCHTTASAGFTTWRGLEAETGSSFDEIDAAVNSLVARGIATRETDADGIELFRLKPEYRLQFAMVYRRLLPMAAILGGPKPFALEEDVRALWHFNEEFPLESLLAFALTAYPQFLTDDVRGLVNQARADQKQTVTPHH
jgi:hypothetical protein